MIVAEANVKPASCLQAGKGGSEAEAEKSACIPRVDAQHSGGSKSACSPHVDAQHDDGSRTVGRASSDSAVPYDGWHHEGSRWAKAKSKSDSGLATGDEDMRDMSIVMNMTPNAMRKMSAAKKRQEDE